MKSLILLVLPFILTFQAIFPQSIDDQLSQRKMQNDLDVFYEIREAANSGLYKYRSEENIDSIYGWAKVRIKEINTYREFYNLLCKLTDYEGSLHNNTVLPEKYKENLKNEQYGYFPIPIKWIDGKWRVNSKDVKIPLGAEILSINQKKIDQIIEDLSRYYTTDGINTTGKRIGINYHFSKYYRMLYGRKKYFTVEYKNYDSNIKKNVKLVSVGFNTYYQKVQKRYSVPFDKVNYKDWEAEEKYSFQVLHDSIALLTVNSFSMGNKNDPEHLEYLTFLDNTFDYIKNKNIGNLIIDVRYNGGGTDPNDLVTYSYLTSRNFQENKQAWISFDKIPFIRYAYTGIPKFLRPFGVRKYNKAFQDEFPKEVMGKFYQNADSEDHSIRRPKSNAFTGNIYLLISPRTASAGSLFAAMVTGNKNSITVGEETMGGYYGHNGHSQLGYILPKTRLGIFFSVVNLEQGVPKKGNQIYNRGIIPDFTISQSYVDFLKQKDTQLNFVLDLIENQ